MMGTHVEAFCLFVDGAMSLEGFQGLVVVLFVLGVKFGTADIVLPLLDILIQRVNEGLRIEEIPQFEANLDLQPHDLLNIELLTQLREGRAVNFRGKEQGSECNHLEVLELHLFLLFEIGVQVVAGVGKDLSVVLLPECFRMQPFQEFLA